MGRIRGKNASPEMIVRRLLHRMGYRFRLHVKNLPGKPDERYRHLTEKRKFEKLEQNLRKTDLNWNLVFNVHKKVNLWNLLNNIWR